MSSCAVCEAHKRPILKACSSGHLVCLQAFVVRGDSLLHRDETGSTPLHLAIRGGHLNCAVFLANAGADLMAVDDLGGSAAHHAAYHGHLPALQWLVSETKGRIAEVSAHDGGSPLHFAAAMGHLDIVKFLVSLPTSTVGDRDHNGTTPLYFAAQEGHLATVQWLLEQGSNPLAQAHDGMCSLHAAAQAGKLDCLRHLWARKDRNVRIRKIRDNDGATPVHFAAAKGHTDCLLWLLQEAAATGDEIDDIGATPVHDAAEQGQLESLKILAHFGANLTVVDQDSYTPRKLALDRNHVECAQFLAQCSARMATGHPAFVHPNLAAKPVIQPSAFLAQPENAGGAAEEEADLMKLLDDIVGGRDLPRSSSGSSVVASRGGIGGGAAAGAAARAATHLPAPSHAAPMPEEEATALRLTQMARKEAILHRRAVQAQQQADDCKARALLLAKQKASPETRTNALVRAAEAGKDAKEAEQTYQVLRSERLRVMAKEKARFSDPERLRRFEEHLNAASLQEADGPDDLDEDLDEMHEGGGDAHAPVPSGKSIMPLTPKELEQQEKRRLKDERLLDKERRRLEKEQKKQAKSSKRSSQSPAVSPRPSRTSWASEETAAGGNDDDDDGLPRPTAVKTKSQRKRKDEAARGRILPDQWALP